MHWLPTVFFGLLTGVFAAVYGGMMAQWSVPWRRISSFEGGAGYYVIGLGLLSFLIGTLVGLVVCRLAGGPDAKGIARGFGAALGVMAVTITGLGGLAWLQRDVPPLVNGRRLDLAVEIRLPPGLVPPRPMQDAPAYLSLHSGSRMSGRNGDLNLAAARQEDGRWILPGTVSLHVSTAPRLLGAALPDAATQFFNTDVPARPAALGTAWSPWLDSYLGTLEPPPPGTALQARYRIIHRPDPPP
ncbi:hypothetical protein ACQW02_06685 [Humitalea sp. 24SJ18S-53]|uniref:hypothetical protein n=1 Tax=Humitalea sp. 24SJ18S-53 TaxID=3422307 RepID=UPI003D664430